MPEEGPGEDGERQDPRACEHEGRDPDGVGEGEVLGLRLMAHRHGELLGQGAPQAQPEPGQRVPPVPADDFRDADGGRQPAHDDRGEDEPTRGSRKLTEFTHLPAQVSVQPGPRLTATEYPRRTNASYFLWPTRIRDGEPLGTTRSHPPSTVERDLRGSTLSRLGDSATTAAV